MKTVTIYAHDLALPVALNVDSMKVAVKIARGELRRREVSEVVVDRVSEFRPSRRVEFSSDYESPTWVEIVIRETTARDLAA